MIRSDILKQFPDLFGTKTVNGRQVNVEETIATLTRELRPDIAAALGARRALLASPDPVTKKYGWLSWDEKLDDPVTGRVWTFRQVVQGLVDNFLGKDSPVRWRLNDEVPIPDHVHPIKNPGLELTGPWAPLDMAFNALNSAAPMNMPDFEDAAPAHFTPEGTPKVPPAIFQAMHNAKEIHEGRWDRKAYEVVKKGKKREYRITTAAPQWPTRFARPPSIHIVYDHVLVDGKPAPGLVVMATLWALSNLDALRRAGSGVYYYVPKLQTPRGRRSSRSSSRASRGSSASRSAPSRRRCSTRRGTPVASSPPSCGRCGAGSSGRTSAAGTTSAASSRCGRTIRRRSSPIPSRWGWRRPT
jgi:malate synthase